MHIDPQYCNSEKQLLVRQLGVIDYAACFKLMQEAIQHKYPQSQQEVWILTHPSVYTQGQAGKPEHLLNLSGIRCVQSDRGGQVTYHGPGQVVCYFLFDLQKLDLSVKNLVDLTTRSVISVCRSLKIEAYEDSKNPGVYTEDGKIASLGFRIRKHMSYHGVAINLNMDLRPFAGINPCGRQQKISQVADLSKELPLFGRYQTRKLFVQAYIESIRETFLFESVRMTSSWPNFSQLK